MRPLLRLWDHLLLTLAYWLRGGETEAERRERERIRIQLDSQAEVSREHPETDGGYL